MGWSFLPYGIVLLILSFAVAQDPPSLEIVGFLKMDTSSYAVQFTTTYTLPGNITQYHVIKTVEENTPQQTDKYTNTPAVETPQGSFKWVVTFDDQVNFTALATKTVHLVLNGLDDANVPVIKGDISVLDFPDVTKGFAGQLSTIEDPTPKGSVLADTILRITAESIGANDVIFPDPEGTIVKSGNIQYHLGVTAPPGNSYALCNTDLITVCDMPEEMDEIPMIKTLTVTESLLSYKDDISGSPAKVVINATSAGAPPSTKLEAIVTGSGGSDPELIEPITDGLAVDFSLTDYTIGNGIQMDIIGLDANSVMKEYVNHPIPDYVVYGAAIGLTSLEVRWNFQEGNNEYFIKRDGDSTSFTEAQVSCNPPDGAANKVCFGYFPGLVTDSYYRVTVAVRTETNNNIQSASIPVGTPTMLHDGNGSLQVEQNIYWNRNGLEGSVRVCFHHVESHRIERDFSHYEFVLINNQNGKWIKHKLMTNDTEGELCFSPKTIQKDIFHHTQGATLVLTQRAQDGFTVLASGEKQIFV